MAQGCDPCRQAAADRIGQAQHVDGESGLDLEGVFDFAGLGVLHDQREQPDERQLRGIEFLADDDRRFGEVVALKQLEAKALAQGKLFWRFDFLRQKALAERLELGDEAAQVIAVHLHDVDLDDVGESEQRPMRVIDLDNIIDSQ